MFIGHKKGRGKKNNIRQIMRAVPTPSTHKSTARKSRASQTKSRDFDEDEDENMEDTIPPTTKVISIYF